MRLFRRITDIISANLNDMADRFEDPETMLKQAVREMEQAVDDALDSAVNVVATEKLATKQLEKHRADAQLCQERARQALAAQDEAAARRAVTRKVQHDSIIAALEDQQTAAAASSNKLRRQIDAMRAKLAEAKRKLATLTARQRVAAARGQLVGVTAGGDLAPFARFDRLAEQVDFAEAEVDARLELNGLDDAGEDPFDAAVELALAKLKEEPAN